MSEQLRQAARAVCDRWGTHDWMNIEDTSELIHRLRLAIDYDAARAAEPAPPTAKCTCVYATAKNTPAVRQGYEMGGYVKSSAGCPVHDTAPSPTAEVEDAITSYLEARDALDNRELAGVNGEPWDVLQRRVHAARKDLDAALQSEAQTGKGE